MLQSKRQADCRHFQMNTNRRRFGSFFFIRRNGGEIFQKIISSSGFHPKESEVMRMYVTYQDMMMFTALLVEVVGLVIAILSYADNKKK